MIPTSRPSTRRHTAAGALKQATCPFCPKRMLKRTLGRHLRAVHHVQDQGRNKKLPEEYCCTQCSETFSRKDNYDRHQAEQHGDKSGLVECTVCGCYVRERTLDIHLKSQKCQHAQHDVGTSQLPSQLQRRAESQMASLSSPGRFDGSTAIDLLVATACCAERRAMYLVDLKNPCRELPMLQDFLAICGLLMRVVSRALTMTYTADAGGIFGLLIALGALMIPSKFSRPRSYYLFDRPPVEVDNHDFIEGTVDADNQDFIDDTVHADNQDLFDETVDVDDEDFIASSLHRMTIELRSNLMLIAMRRENSVLAGIMNALQARLGYPVADVEEVATSLMVNSPFHLPLVPTIFEGGETVGVRTEVTYQRLNPAFVIEDRLIEHRLQAERVVAC